MLDALSALGIDQLSIAERIQLVEEIWDSIAAEADAIEIPLSHRREMDRRLDAGGTDLRLASSWSDVRERLRQRLCDDQ